MRRHGVLELLLVLPDGSKSLVPAGWTDADRSGVDGGTAATLGSLIDLLQVCELVADWPDGVGRSGDRLRGSHRASPNPANSR
jgi:hypothetical protein